ncbi:MAG: HEPN domain-containing protein [Cyclobacteriaceae bacterium]|nr:HEPN domain-containing protein [Cyclobacteriaceae bacterium]MCX7637961.1 HEPN domain-containing protein [Cyclobacteriaceae bacterium]MDW8331985.1 HEPN domain-containing protein [Cyclobacteriaceae bacterium]
MGKNEQIKYWIQSADEDWETALALFELKRYLHTLFLLHLVIEKLLKANWILDNFGNIPPFTHNLEQIYNETNMELSPEDVDFIRSLSAWNIEGRYPDYKNKLHRMATREYTLDKLEKVKKLRLCLLGRLSSIS